jgi:glyoxylase-like metal-dependent hydrolase (beta-lactamase superfamily II)
MSWPAPQGKLPSEWPSPWFGWGRIEEGGVFGISPEYTVTALTMFVSTRRTFLTAAAAGIAAPCAFAQAPKITTAPLGDNLYLLSGAGGNVIARTGAEGVVMVDGGLAQNAEALAQAVAAFPNSGSVRTLFNTHWHPEQTGSNEKLGMAGATIIAQ